MRKLFPIIILMLLVSSVNLSGQFSTRQAGVRFGYRSGIYYQAGSETGNAETGYNFMMSFNNHGLQVTGLKVIYENSFKGISPNLFFGWGYGGHIGYTYTDHVKAMGDDYYFHDERFCPLFGIDGWLTAEYRINDIPLIVSLNLKPYVEITIPAFVRLMPADFGFSIAYIF